MKRICLILVAFFRILIATPEDEIVVIENFISRELAQLLINYHKNNSQILQKETDNQISFNSVQDFNILSIVRDISLQVERLLPSSYQFDHGGIYARISGNFCPYHTDNGYFSCKIHGSDQETLRRNCPGTCLGILFKPNHTFWRKYTALIYLNDDFEGGQIVFEDGPWNYQYRKKIPIKEGMLVLSPTGPEFYHEVEKIEKGTRYSLHLWYK